MKDNISFDEVKQIFRESIDESANINELLQNVANKIFLKGKDESSEQPMSNKTRIRE